MIASQQAGRKRIVVCTCLAILAALAVMVLGRGNPGEGTVHVDPKLATKLPNKS